MEELLEEVKPGKLITARFMKQVLERIGSLEERVSGLEKGIVDDGSVVITGWIPHTPRVGEPFQILGRNFEYTIGGHSVYFDDKRVLSFSSGSDTMLVLNVPTTLKVPEGGRDVDLAVANTTSSQVVTIRVLPLLEEVVGNVDPLWGNEISPNPIVPNQPATVKFRLRSRATAADFLISADIPTWPSTLRVLDSEKRPIPSKRIHLDEGEEKDFFIEIDRIPPGTEDTEFTLTVTASAGDVSGSYSRNIPIGQVVEPVDDTITIAPSAFEPASAFSNNTIRLSQGEIGTMTLDATFTKVPAPGETDVYDVDVRLEPPTANWTCVLHETPDQYELDAADFIGGEAKETPAFRLRPDAGASASGAVVVLSIGRVGGPPPQEARFDLSLV